MSLGTPTLVAQFKTSGSAGTSISATTTAPIPSGSTAFVVVGVSSTSHLPVSVTDNSSGVTYRLVGFLDNGNATRCILGVYYAYLPSGLASGAIFTSPLTGSSSNSRHMAVFYVTGRAIVDGPPEASIASAGTYTNTCPDVSTAAALGISVAYPATSGVTPNSTPSATELLDYFEGGGAFGDRTLFISHSSVSSGGSFVGSGINAATVQHASISFMIREAPTTYKYEDEIMRAVPSNRWKFDETSGAVADDAIGTLDGTYVSSPTLNQTGVPNIPNTKAVQHVAASSHDTTLPFVVGASTDFSIGCWVKLSTVTTALMRDNTGTNGTIVCLPSTGTWTLRVAATSAASRARIEHLCDGAWHHIGLSRNGSTARLYLDGVCILSTALGTGALTSPMHLAKNGTGANYENVTHDDFSYFTTVVSPLKMSAIARAGLEGGVDQPRMAYVG